MRFIVERESVQRAIKEGRKEYLELYAQCLKPIFYSLKSRLLDSEGVATTPKPLGTTFPVCVATGS
jgi:hypothetical protein